MTPSIHFFLTAMFWIGLLSLISSSVYLVMDHPRQQRPINIGTDLLSLIWSLGMFAWVAVLLYG